MGPRLLAAAALAGLVGCAALRPVDPNALPVDALRLDFPSPGTGQLEFAVPVPAGVPAVDRVEWELFLDGHRFAAGVEGALALEDGHARVRTPLAFRFLGWREGRGWLEVRLRGALETPGRRFTFRERREVEVSGRPVLNAPLE